jgi:hypothetical protein
MTGDDCLSQVAAKQLSQGNLRGRVAVFFIRENVIGIDYTAADRTERSFVDILAAMN